LNWNFVLDLLNSILSNNVWFALNLHCENVFRVVCRTNPVNSTKRSLGNCSQNLMESVDNNCLNFNFNLKPFVSHCKVFLVDRPLVWKFRQENCFKFKSGPFCTCQVHGILTISPSFAFIYIMRNRLWQKSPQFAKKTTDTFTRRNHIMIRRARLFLETAIMICKPSRYGGFVWRQTWLRRVPSV